MLGRYATRIGFTNCLTYTILQLQLKISARSIVEAYLENSHHRRLDFAATDQRLQPDGGIFYDVFVCW